MAIAYTALIRTHNSFPVVERVVRALKAQTAPPERIVIVDSHSTDSQRRAMMGLADEIVEYPDEAFNFSKAINLGVASCRSPWVLIISSHVVLKDCKAIERASNEMAAVGAQGFYLHRTPKRPWFPEVVGERNFDGRNGLSNACGFIPVGAAAARPFREEVFSAEDQEWAAHFLKEGRTILRIGVDSLDYLNPHSNETKIVNEEVSIAYFTCRKRLGVRFLAGWLLRAAIYFAAGRRKRSVTYLTIFREVLRARSTPPVRVSRYF